MTTTYSPLTDGVLRVQALPDVSAQLEGWLPLGATPETPTGRHRLEMRIGSAGAFGLYAPAGLAAPDLTIGTNTCHLRGDVAWITGPSGCARVDAGAGEATIELGAAATEVAPLLSLVTALLLARVGRYLLHCAAVSEPDGGVWLLAGDSRAGKTTTALNLARAGWSLLSDDHVVVLRGSHGWQVEGWPRALHPDAGWRDGVITHRRDVLDPRHIDIRLERTGPLDAVLLPRIARDAERSGIAAASSSDTLTMLLRQTAWSLADRTVAADVLRDLADMAAAPSFHLMLAPDTFREPERLHDLLVSGAIA